jgi:ABC-type glycerol-3-phosphate transport system substrate-binding protein
LLLPLDDLIARFEEEDPEGFGIVHPAVWEDGTFDGQIYQAAILGNFEVLYYDVEWFAEAGFEPVLETWDDVLEAARALKAARPDEYPFPVPGLTGEYTNGFLQQMRSTGVPFDGPIPDLTSPQALYLIGWYQTMVAEGLINPESAGWIEDDSRGSFIGRRAGILMEGLSTAKDFLDIPDYAYGEQWGATIMPLKTTADAEPGTPSIIPRGLSIVATTEHPYEASLAIRYMLEEENAVSKALNGSQPPRLTSPMSGLDDFFPHFTPAVREGFYSARANPTADNIYDIEQVFQTLLNALVSGADESPEEIAATYQAQFDALR